MRWISERFNIGAAIISLVAFILIDIFVIPPVWNIFFGSVVHYDFFTGSRLLIPIGSIWIILYIIVTLPSIVCSFLYFHLDERDPGSWIEWLALALFLVVSEILIAGICDSLGSFASDLTQGYWGLPSFDLGVAFWGFFENVPVVILSTLCGWLIQVWRRKNTASQIHYFIR